MPTPASRRVREPLHEQGLCNGYGRGKMWLLRREPDSGGLTRTGPDGAVDNERRGSVLSVRPMRALPLVIALFMLWGVARSSNPGTEYTLDSHGGVTSVETLTPDESWKRTEDRRIEAELAGRKPEAGKTHGESIGSGRTPTSAGTRDLLLGSQRNLRMETKWWHTSKIVERHAGFRHIIRPNQTMQPL